MRFPTASEAKLNAAHRFNAVAIELTYGGKVRRIDQDGKLSNVVYRIKTAEQRIAVLNFLNRDLPGEVRFIDLSDYTGDRQIMSRFPNG